MAKYGDSSKSNYGGSKVNYGKARAVQREKEKERQKQEEQRMMRAQIEAEYQANLAKKNKRGALDRVFDVISTPGYMVNGALQEGWKGVGEGFKAGMDGFVPGDKEYGKEYEFNDTLDKATGGAWNNWETDKWYEKGAKGAVNLIGEILTDPTTYIGGAGIAKSITKGSGKRVGKEASKEITEQMVRVASKEKALDLLPEQVTKYTKKANKIAGNTATKGDVTFAGVRLNGSGEALRTLGDKTIAPYLNTLGDAVGGANKLFSNNAEVRKKLLDGKLGDFIGEMHVKDSAIAEKINKFDFIGTSARNAEKAGFKNKKGNDEMMRELTDLMENPKSYTTDVMREEVPQGEKLLETFVEHLTGTSYGEHQGAKTTAKIWDDVLQSENPMDRLGMPRDSYEKWVFKKQIDPDNKYATYEEAYNNLRHNADRANEAINLPTDYEDAVLSKPKQQVYDDGIFSTIQKPGYDLELEMPEQNMHKALQMQRQELINNELIELTYESGDEAFIEIATDARTRKYYVDNYMTPDGEVNMEMIRRGVEDGIFKDSASAIKQISDLSVIEDLNKGHINSPRVKQKYMNLDAMLPAEFQTKDMYMETAFDPNTGEIFETAYDPFTGGSSRIAVQRAMLDAMPKPAEMSKLDWLLKESMTDEMLTKQFNDYLDKNGLREGVIGKHVIDKGNVYIENTVRRLNEQTLSAKPELMEMAKYLFDEFKSMGLREEYAGKLFNKIEAYMPHMLNQDLLKNPNFLKTLEKQDPELFRTIFKSAGEKWNPHGTERSVILENKVKEILVNKRKSMNQDYSDITGKSIAQVNEALKPILEQAGFDGNFFMDNAYEIYMQRMLTHGEVIYANRTINQTLENFGRFVPRSDINPKGKYVINQQELKEVFKNMNETQQFQLIQEMGIPTDKVYNKMLIEVDGERAQKLFSAVDKYGAEGNRPVQIYTLPENILRSANQKGYVQQFDDTKAFLKVYDKFTNLWKQTATVINPGFHMRNAFSNTFQNFLAVGMDAVNPQTRSIARQILSNSDGDLVTKNGTVIPFKEIRDQLASRDIVNMQAFSPVEGFMGDATSLFGEELKGSGGAIEAIGRALQVKNPTALNKIDPTDTQNFIGFTAGRKFGGKVEDFDRTLNFIANIKNDLSFDDAQDMVNKFLFDYSDLTPFETNVMKRIIPFYTWVRKNAPLQMEMLLTKPGVYAGVADITAMTKSDDPNLPDYMTDYMQLPIKWNNLDMMVDVNMPYQDLGKDYSDPATTIGMLNPFLKAGIELGTNKNYFFDSEIVDKDDTFQQGMDKVGKYMKQSMMGGYNTWEKALQGDISKIGSMATGVTLKGNDADKNKSDAIYRAIREIEARMEEEKMTGQQYRYNQEFEEYKNTKLKKYGYTD